MFIINVLGTTGQNLISSFLFQKKGWDEMKVTDKDKKAEKPVRMETLFSKEQLLSSEKFRDRRDILNALLSSEGQYTVKAVEGKIEDYMKGKVK